MPYGDDLIMNTLNKIPGNGFLPRELCSLSSSGGFTATHFFAFLKLWAWPTEETAVTSISREATPTPLATRRPQGHWAPAFLTHFQSSFQANILSQDQHDE